MRPQTIPDKIYFIDALQQAIHRLRPVLQDHLLQAKKDRHVRNQIDAWAVRQGYPLGLPNLDELLSCHWAYSLAIRILFYLTIRRYYPALPDLFLAPNGAHSLITMLQDAFSKAQNVGWLAVFECSPLDNLGLPPSTEPILRDLLNGFWQYNFSHLKEDVIGQILEGLIPKEERHALGQYFTREDLADLIIGFVANQERAFYLDPTCGSGVFLNRLYSRLRWLSAYKATHGNLIEQIWGVDIAHLPAELATINLFRQDIRDPSNPPRVIVQDLFDLRPGQVISFPGPIITNTDYHKTNVVLPTFHGIVGNFPYIRQELIERQNPGYKKKIVLSIAQEWFWKDPDLFEIKGGFAQDIAQAYQIPLDKRQNWLKEQIDRGRISLRLSGQADIYAYLFFHAAAFLEEGGRMGVVTSNAWLDTAYGEELKRFFLRHFKIIAIVASWCESWFDDAAVNTAFTILERCSDPAGRANNTVRFVKIKRPLAEILPQDLLSQEAERWQKVDALVRQIESAGVQVALRGPTTEQAWPPRGICAVETNDFRIRLVPQAELEAELQARGPAAKWGFYIRAPQVCFDILQEARGKLVPLNKVAEVRSGCTTGINDFFYHEPLDEPAETHNTMRVKNARGWKGEIEKDLLMPALLSFKEVKTLTLSDQKARRYLFLCPYDRRELQKRGYLKALEYIQWGEQQRTAGRGSLGTNGIPFPQVSTVKPHRPEWFNLPQREPGKIVSNRFIGRRFGFPLNSGLAISDAFFEILPYSHEDLYAALLNSTVSFLLIETLGRPTWARGVLGLYGPELRDLPVPEAPQIPAPLRERIVAIFDQLKQRPILPIAQEVKQKDRQALDVVVLEALGLDPKEYLPRIYDEIVKMVQERHVSPKMHTSRKKQEKRPSIIQVKERVQQDVLPVGLKPITAFLPPDSNPQMMTVLLTGRPVSWQFFLTEFTLIDEAGNEVGKLMGNEKTACYVIYGARAGECLIEVPADPFVVNKAVQGYEYYLRDVWRQLVARSLETTKDYKQAEQIAREILESLGLSSLAIKKAMEG